MNPPDRILTSTEQMSLLHWKHRVGRLQEETGALYLVYKHPCTPWYAKVVVACVVVYAFSPIDLIPDFIPVLGYLDDLVLIPIGFMIALWVAPDPNLTECRRRTGTALKRGRPKNRIILAVIVVLCLVILSLLILWGLRMVTGKS